MDEFWQDLVSGDIQFRDKWQFELKSEFYPRSTKDISTYIQEFYIFIPNALQINEQTYSKEEFYRNQTNLIRFKTPEFSLAELVSPNEVRSPLNKLKAAYKSGSIDLVEDELKLLGNIFRSALRRKTLKILTSAQPIDHEIEIFCSEIRSFRKQFLEIKEKFFETYTNDKLYAYFQYIDEFLCNSIEHYLTGLLNELRNEAPPLPKESDDRMCQTLLEVKKHLEKLNNTAPLQSDKKSSKEEILYRDGLLNKFVLDALLLHTSRASIQQKYGHYIGAISAAVAMLVFLLLYIWQGQVFLINSQPFIIVTVIAYVLKDRIKEWLKNISYQRALRWFSDYTTEIKSPEGDITLGELRESFTFVNEDSIPSEITAIRNREFHTVLETVKRPEQVIYIKKTLRMFPQEKLRLERRKALNITFRFNIQDFLAKASDPYHNYITLDPENKALVRTRLPKIYHLNVLLKNSFYSKNAQPYVELKKFRIIVDKNGIKHIEQVRERP